MNQIEPGLMLLQHATPRRNQYSIGRRGLLAKLSQGKARRVWLHAADETLWALQHVAKRHGVSPAECIVYRAQVAPERVKRGPRKGLFWISGDVHPDDLIGRKDAAECLTDPEGW